PHGPTDGGANCRRWQMLSRARMLCGLPPYLAIESQEGSSKNSASTSWMVSTLIRTAMAEPRTDWPAHDAPDRCSAGQYRVSVPGPRRHTNAEYASELATQPPA